MQVLDNLLFVRWLDTSEALRAAGGAGLLTLAEIVEFLASVSLAKGLLISGEDADLAADGDGSVLKCFKLKGVANGIKTGLRALKLTEGTN